MYYLKTYTAITIYWSIGLDSINYSHAKKEFYQKHTTEKFEYLFDHYDNGLAFIHGGRVDLWETPESYFLDWKLSHEFKDLTILKEGLDDLEKNLNEKGIDEFDGMSNSFCLSHSKEYNFITRIFYRKIYQLQKEDPEIHHLDHLNRMSQNKKNELFKKSIIQLKEALKKDAKFRKTHTYAKLDNFTRHDELRNNLLKNTFKNWFCSCFLWPTIIIIIKEIFFPYLPFPPPLFKMTI